MSTGKLDRETVLETVVRYKTVTYNVLADKLGVHRSSIGRFFKSNPEVLKEANKLLKETDKVTFTENAVTDIDVFRQIPIIAEYETHLLKKGTVKKNGIRGYLFGVMRVCNALQVHPSKLDIDYLSDKVYEWKVAKENGQDYPRGCAYNTIRKPLRSFLTIMYGVTPEQLTLKGIGAEHSDGFAEASKEKLDSDERISIMDELREAIIEVFNEEGIDTAEYPVNDYWLEMFGAMVFMYYTATRINATLDARFNDNKSVYKQGYYEIHITDKGRGSRLEWNKRLIGNGYDLFTLYVKERFGISVDAQPDILKSYDSLIFPLLSKSYELETSVMKRVQENTNSYKITQVNHLWRHTFAQDWLEAMEGNYEVGAEIGGWKDIGTMKRCYGAVSNRIVMRGIKKAMGLPVEEETHKLRFVKEEDDKLLYNLIKTRGE